jgi:GntR family transcriptional repressor for pyruvate dehydrogenase complex
MDTPFTPVRSARLSEEIIRQIARLVETRQLQINERFPSERALQEHWKVSRPVLREAFRALEVQGMVESRPGGGRYLRSSWIPDPARHHNPRLEANRENLLQIWEARETVETKAAELAAKFATADQIRALGVPLQMLTALPPAKAVSIDFNREFHLVIAGACCNPLIEEMVVRLVARSNEIGFKEFMDVEDFANLLLIHQPIFDAIAHRKPAAARRAMAEHFAELRRRIEVRPATSLQGGPGLLVAKRPDTDGRN